MGRGASGINIQSLSWQIEACHAAGSRSKLKSEIGQEMKSRLPADRQTDTVGNWRGCRVDGASSYKETVNLTQERAEKLILTLLN